jgi:hypothetical protein
MITKVCSKCKECKGVGEFGKHKKSRDGLRSDCRVCNTATTRAWKQQNKERASANNKNYANRNKERVAAYIKAWQERNPAKVMAATRKYQASKLNATPSWVDTSEIVDFYEAARAFRIYTGQEYHVNHIVPLQGKTVCGLHVPANLQVLPATVNLSKQNKYWPDMWEKL